MGLMNKQARIMVAGSGTFIGGAIQRVLKDKGLGVLVGDAKDEPPLIDRAAVEEYFSARGPEYVFLAAGPAHGIVGNLKYPAELIHDNLLIECHVIDAARRHGVKRLIYLASNCCYPRDCPQPMKEKYILTGPLEPTNEPYSVARIAGLKLVESYRKQYGSDFIAAIPANSFGPGDDFSPEDSHVVGALMRRMHQAKQKGEAAVTVWGSGKPRRQFMYVDELAQAAIFAMDNYQGGSPINLGPGGDQSIAELAQAIKEVVGFEGELVFDPAKPDGMPRKLLETSELQEMGWQPQMDFHEALARTYEWFCEHAV